MTAIAMLQQISEFGADPVLPQPWNQETRVPAMFLEGFPKLLERQIGQLENAISILLGNSGDIPRGLKLTEQPHLPEVPAGVPSSLLKRRADVRESEANLIAAGAQIGVARAAYFPQISLTGTAGYESPALTNLFTGPAGLWNLTSAMSQPIFAGGRLKSNVRLAEAPHQQLLLTYQQTIQGAFRDVSNGLIAYRKFREFRIQQEHLFESAQDAAHLSEVRFKAGTTDYFEVLTNQTNSFPAELGPSQAQGDELIGMAQLYKAFWRRMAIALPEREDDKVV
jgi:multidrug efflux system outer membrane protein